MKVKVFPIIASIVALGGGYLIYDYFKNKKKLTDETKKEPDAGSIPDKSQPSNVLVQPVKLSSPSQKIDSYMVKISSGTLNLRQLPNTKSKIIGTYKNGETIKAQPSMVNGWHEVVDTKGSYPVVIGYVSSKYVMKG